MRAVLGALLTMSSMFWELVRQECVETLIDNWGSTALPRASFFLKQELSNFKTQTVRPPNTCHGQLKRKTTTFRGRFVDQD